MWEFWKKTGGVYPNPTSIFLLFLTWETSQKETVKPGKNSQTGGRGGPRLFFWTMSLIFLFIILGWFLYTFLGNIYIPLPSSKRVVSVLYNFTQNHKYFTLPLLVLLVKNIMSVPASWSNFASIESLDIQVPMISSIYTLLKYNRFIPSCLREYISQNTSRRKFQRLKRRGNTSSKPSHPFKTQPLSRRKP